MNALVMVPDGIGNAVALAGSHLMGKGRRRLRASGAPGAGHLERIVEAFQGGFLSACRDPSAAALCERLAAVPVFHRGFAYEGAAMALGLLDRLRPWAAPRLPRLFDAAEPYTYLLHVGAGWALARYGRAEGRRLHRLDPVLKWLAIDGVGFHDVFMRPSRQPLTRPRRGLSPYGARAYDQGLGRGLWFTARLAGGITAAVRSVNRSRHPDLWSGVGLACGYAGGVTAEEIRELAGACGPLHPHFAQGAAFAAAAHRRPAGAVPPHTALACEVICGTSGAEVADVVERAAVDLPAHGAEPAYETWRARVRARWS